MLMNRSRGGTTQGRPPRQKGTNDESYDLESQQITKITVQIYVANHSDPCAPPTCLLGAQDPGPNPRGPRAVSMTCMIASTFSSSHGRPTTCTPTGSPFIADGLYAPFGP